MASNGDESVQDPWAFILELSHISPSQEQILATAPFVGAEQDTVDSASHDIDMLSLPDSVPEDVFHTPPEESSLPSSSSDNHCVVNYAVVDVNDVDVGTDLVNDSELGFSDVHMEEVNGEDMGNLETLLGDVSINVSESAEGSKSSDGAVESRGKKKKKQSKQGKNKSAVSGEQKKTDKEAGPGLRRVLPPSIAASTSMTETGSGRSGNGGGGEKRKAFDVFAVLKAFSELESTVEENNDHHLTLLEVARAHGVTFPRPRWWPEGDNFDPPPPPQ